MKRAVATSIALGKKGERGAVPIQKNRPQQLVLRRLRKNLLYSKLRSLLPRQPTQQHNGIGAGFDMCEFEPAPGEIPEEEPDEETPQNSPAPVEMSECEDSGDDEEESSTSASAGEEQKRSGFVPSVKLRRIGKALLISTVVLKDVALTSTLFKLLEEEKLDILYEHQYRTLTKVSHTIQVTVSPEFDTEELEKKLGAWAGKQT